MHIWAEAQWRFPEENLRPNQLECKAKTSESEILTYLYIYVCMHTNMYMLTHLRTCEYEQKCNGSPGREFKTKTARVRGKDIRKWNVDAPTLWATKQSAWAARHSQWCLGKQTRKSDTPRATPPINESHIHTQHTAPPCWAEKFQVFSSLSLSLPLFSSLSFAPALWFSSSFPYKHTLSLSLSSFFLYLSFFFSPTPPLFLSPSISEACCLHLLL